MEQQESNNSDQLQVPNATQNGHIPLVIFNEGVEDEGKKDTLPAQRRRSRILSTLSMDSNRSEEVQGPAMVS